MTTTESTPHPSTFQEKLAELRRQMEGPNRHDRAEILEDIFNIGRLAGWTPRQRYFREWLAEKLGVSLPEPPHVAMWTATIEKPIKAGKRKKKTEVIWSRSVSDSPTQAV